MYVFVSIDATTCVDENVYGYGRYLNHSIDCNLKGNIVHDSEGVVHFVFTAQRDIMCGEELLFDYGDRRKEAVAHNTWLKPSSSSSSSSLTAAPTVRFSFASPESPGDFSRFKYNGVDSPTTSFLAAQSLSPTAAVNPQDNHSSSSNSPGFKFPQWDGFGSPSTSILQPLYLSPAAASSPPNLSCSPACFPPIPQSPLNSLIVNIDDAQYQPHPMSVSLALKFKRLVFQYQKLLEHVKEISKDDVENNFPFHRQTIANPSFPHSTAHFDNNFLLTNSSLLPGLIAVTARMSSKPHTKLFNYPGFILTDDEYCAFIDKFGVFTGVTAHSLRSLINKERRIKTNFIVILTPIDFDAHSNYVHL